VRPHDVLQIGLRGPLTAANDLEASKRYGFSILSADQVEDDLPSVVRAIAALAGKGPVYVSFDMDALDPTYAPGTGTPVPGGLTSRQALRLVRALRGLQIVGCDVVEISPDHDPSGNTALLAASVLTEILAALSATRATAQAAR
jgi:arginase family enzyme